MLFRSVQKMLQALIVDRFKLVSHRETRELPVYALVADKGGPKFKEVHGGRSGTSGSPGRLEAHATRMPDLANMLFHEVDRPVLDKTELPGFYEFTLLWTPDRFRGAAPGDGAGKGLPDPGGPSIFTALREQLGLRLEPQKAPIEVLVVDRAEKTPTEN